MDSSVDASIVIPAHNEEQNILVLVNELVERLGKEKFSYEIVIVNDNSADNTLQVAQELSKKFLQVKVVNRSPPRGFGRAIKDGLRNAKGEVIATVMGDLSDDADDVARVIKKALDGYDVVYGSRFMVGGQVDEYPKLKLFYNRMFNNLTRIVFGLKHKDLTNAFKAYRKEVVEKIGVDNIKSNHFDITIEIALRAHMLGFKSVEVPVRWHGGKRRISKLSFSKMGPLYLKRLIEMFFYRFSTKTQ